MGIFGGFKGNMKKKGQTGSDEAAMERIRNTEARRDAIRGCMIGGAVGDALGYAVEFVGEDRIFKVFGDTGITKYELDVDSVKALISDDTQMALFTANGILTGKTRNVLHGIQKPPREYVAKAYQDWLRTQEISYEEYKARQSGDGKFNNYSWLSDVPQLYDRRAPGNTCLFALKDQKKEKKDIADYVQQPVNDSKGCGGVMRVAPMGMVYPDIGIKKLDMEGAQIAAITHGHSLGYMPAAVLTHVIHRIVFAEKPMPLKDIVLEARDTVAGIFSDDPHIKQLVDLINLAVQLSENDDPDLANIHRLGKGWVADEALAIALYCALKYQNDFSAGIIASVNHRGDSDSTGAIVGNILGALLGFDAIEEKWKEDLELYDVILEIADDLYRGCRMSEHGSCCDPAWERKYVMMSWKNEQE